MADASYIIDIAAQMPEGEVTTAQLDDMVKGLTGAGKGADFFQVALKQVSASLASAKAATASANAALAEGTGKYRELEKAASTASKTAEKAALKGKLSPEIAAQAVQAEAALDGYAHTLKSLEQNAAAATKAEAGFARQLDNVKKLSAHTDKTVAGAAEATEKLRGGLASVPGPVGKIGSALLAPVQGFQKLSASMGSSNAAMLLTATAAAGVVVAVVAITAAVIAGTIAIAAWAVGLADAKRMANLHSEAVRAMSPELEGLRSTFADVTKATGLQNDELEALAKKLSDAKTPADRIAGALSDAALQEAALGKGGADDFIAKIRESKGAVTGLANETRLALGGIVAKQLRGIDAQSATIKKNFSSLFSGLDIEPVLKGLERLGALFDQNTAAGQTIKFLFESIFQPLIDQAETAAVVIEAFAIGFLIGLTKAYIAVKPALAAVKEFFGFKDASLSDTLALVKRAGELVVPAFLVFAGVLAAIAAAIGVAVAASVAWTVAIYSAIAAVVGLGVAIFNGLMSAMNSVNEFLVSAPAKMLQLGSDLIAGLANGIVAGKDAVVGAVTGAVSGAIASAKKLLGIASPSKVFAEIGAYTGEGFAQGVDDSAPDAQTAMTTMVNPAPPAASAQPAASSAGGSSGPMLHIENLYLAGAKASEAETLSLADALTRIIKGDAAAMGGEPAPA